MSDLPTALFLWLLVFCCCLSKSTGLRQVAIVEDAKDLKACNLSSNITTLSLKELESHLSSDTEVYLCSLKSSVILNTSISIHDVHNVSFIGQNNFTFDCKGRTGIRFSNILGLKVRDLNLIHCSCNYTMDVHYKGNKIFPFLSGMNIENCTDITFTHVIISNSSGTGMSIFNTKGTIALNGCRFLSNGDSNSKHGGNGLFIELSENFPSNQSINDSQYIITHSIFTNNHAHEVDIPSTPFGRGGAICIFIREQSSRNNITISDCDFCNNSASRWGGAFFGSIHDSATRNAVVVKDSRFTHNQSPLGKGGAANVGYHCADPGLCLKNSFLFDSCTFEHNRAQIGGGTAFISTRVHNITVDKTRYNTIEYRKCTWVNNSAHYGAAIALLPDVWSLFKLGSLPSPNFTDCTINSNNVTENNTQNSTLKAPYMQQTMGAGTMYCMLYTVHFNGQTKMKNNSGSAILGSSCKLSFCKQSSANFQHNRGYYGGAMFLIGYSTIKTAFNSSLSFINNTATLSGGAIYCKSSDILEHAYSRSCFISRSDMSDINSVSFLFSGNKAGTGNDATALGDSIYVTSLLPCMREYHLSGTQCSYSLFNRIANFTFPPDKTNQVLTDVTTFSSPPNATSQNLTMVSIIPGKYTTLPFIGHDDLDTARNNVYVVTVNKHANSSVASHHGYSYISNNSIILIGYPGDEATIKLSTLGLHKAVLSFKVKLQRCPPGYVIQPDDNKYSKECICSADTKQLYIGIESCNTSEFRAKRRDGFWFGYDSRIESDASFISGYCPTGFCTFTRFRGDLLPPNASVESLNDFICQPNREDTLCSKCKENYSVYFHSPTFKCGKRDLCHLGWLFYILSDIIPVTIVFVVVLAFNISFTSGSMNGFIFYAQVISFFQITAHSRIYASAKTRKGLGVLETLYKMFNLQFFDHSSLSFCLLRHANNLTIMRFQYVSFIYSFFLLVFILLTFRVCNIRRIKLCCKCRVHSIQNSMVHGISAFFVLCFAQCAKISLSLLSYGRIQGKRERVIRKVVLLYGDYDWFGHKHLWYVLPAMIVAFFMVFIPLVIILAYPNGHKCLHILKLRERKCTLAISKFLPIHKLKPFLDSFQGCFKDNCRCFSGLYFLYRVFILLNVSINYTNYFYITLQVQLIVMLLLHATFQPYKKRKHNIIDSFLFVNMLLINSISQYSFGKAHIPSPVGKYYGRHLPAIQGILILLPLAIVLAYFTCKILRTLVVKLKCKGRDAPNADLLDYCQLAAERSEPTHTSINHSKKYNTFP